MADFKTHITVSTLAGALLGAGGYQSGMPWESCLIAGGLCSVSGMLPDLDSDSGIPLREAVAFAAAFVPMLMLDRLERVGLSHEMMLVVTGVIYFFLRFGIAELFRRYTVHRGMWHSLPAALIAARFVFLVSASENIHPRLFKTLAVFVGFMSHILLDELWSVEFRRGKYVFKHSFGTALKFFGESRLANVATYLLLIAMSVVVYHDEAIMEHFGYAHQHDLPHTAVDWLKTIREQSEYWIR
ncbi:MAG: metal-dependent hydrolase [Planctomycetota bacterium]